MQTQTVKTREELEAAIEEQKELIDEERYELRWYTRGFFTSGCGAILCVVSSIILNVFPKGVVSNIFLPTSVASGFVAVVAVIAAGVAYQSYLDSYKYKYKSDKMSTYEKLRQKKRTLKKLMQKLAYIDELALRYLTAEQYKHQLPLLIKSYRTRADRFRRWFTTISVTTILFSAAITSLSGGWVDKYVSIPWAIPVLSVSISILTSLTLFFKFREKGANLQETSDKLDLEYMSCTLGIGDYKNLQKDEALVILAERAEALRKEQQQRQLQLEQSSQADQKALQSTT